MGERVPFSHADGLDSSPDGIEGQGRQGRSHAVVKMFWRLTRQPVVGQRQRLTSWGSRRSGTRPPFHQLHGLGAALALCEFLERRFRFHAHHRRRQLHDRRRGAAVFDLAIDVADVEHRDVGAWHLFVASDVVELKTPGGRVGGVDAGDRTLVGGSLLASALLIVIAGPVVAVVGFCKQRPRDQRRRVWCRLRSRGK